VKLNRFAGAHGKSISISGEGDHLELRQCVSEALPRAARDVNVTSSDLHCTGGASEAVQAAR
jgi:hypothetical protein